MKVRYTSIAVITCLIISGCGGNSDSDDTPASDQNSTVPVQTAGDNVVNMPDRLVSSIAASDGAEILTDNDTGLRWVNDIQFCFAGVNRPEDSNCDVLNEMEVGGLTAWRLPTSDEMSDLTLAVDADEDVTLNYINANCAVMTTSDGWVFTENSNAPGMRSMVEPGNAGVRCVSGEPLTDVADAESRLRTVFSEDGSTEMLRDTETALTWVNDIQYCFAGVTDTNATSCNTLNEMVVGGLSDWRTPDTSEMSDLITAVVADDEVTLNYINPNCAVMTASDGWVFTENSQSPGTISQVQPGNAGIRCVSPSMP